MKSIKSTLQKLQALANGTNFEHERESALEHLYRLMDKHGITEQDLSDEATSTYELKFKGKRERHLLLQVLYKVFGNMNWTQYAYTRNGRKISTQMGVDCTSSQKVEIDFLFGFYKDLYRREEETFYGAFIQKHSIFGNSTGDGKELSKEEALKLHMLMEGMSDDSPQRRLTVGN